MGERRENTLSVCLWGFAATESRVMLVVDIRMAGTDTIAQTTQDCSAHARRPGDALLPACLSVCLSVCRRGARWDAIIQLCSNGSGYREDIMPTSQEDVSVAR